MGYAIGIAVQGDSADVARLGLSISPSKTARDLLVSYLQVAPREERAHCIDKRGWHGDLFVTASEYIGCSTVRVVFQNTNFIEPAQSVAGPMEEWRDSIGQLSSGNSRLIFASSTAFAPTLAKLVIEVLDMRVIIISLKFSNLKVMGGCHDKTS